MLGLQTAFLLKCLSAVEAFTEVTVDLVDLKTTLKCASAQGRRSLYTGMGGCGMSAGAKTDAAIKMFNIIVETLSISEGGCCTLKG